MMSVLFDLRIFNLLSVCDVKQVTTKCGAKKLRTGVGIMVIRRNPLTEDGKIPTLEVVTTPCG